MRFHKWDANVCRGHNEIIQINNSGAFAQRGESKNTENKRGTKQKRESAQPAAQNLIK